MKEKVKAKREEKKKQRKKVKKKVDNFRLNKIAARWPAKAVAQLSFSQ